MTSYPSSNSTVSSPPHLLSRLAPVAPLPALTIHRAFEFWAESTPEAEATTCSGIQLTYGGLNAAANQLAHFLIAQGIQFEAPIGICTERSIDMIVGQLGILKAGGVYVPIDANFPELRINFILRDTGSGLVLTQEHLHANLPDSPGITVHRLDSPTSPWCNYPTENPNLSHDPRQLASIIYTSGSTGKPKGVALTHQGVVRLVRGQNYAPFGPTQRYLMLASPSFDAIIFELWGPLLNGGCCVVFPERWPEAHRLAGIIRDEKITCCFLTTGLFNQIIDHEPETLAPLHTLLIGGEALSVQHIKHALEILPDLKLVNGYGPTECTTFACAYQIGPPETWPCETVPLGLPLNNTECLIVDQNTQVIPISEPGEILLGGPGLAREYWNRPALTSERFIPHPLSHHTGERLYRTGDRGRILPSGHIEYLGRLDHQIKVRGFRIEPGEVEHAIRQLPGVCNTAVFVRKLPGGNQLVACVVLEDHSAEIPAIDLQVWLRNRLPEFMVPSLIRFVEQLPLTFNGKVDRIALNATQAEPAPVEPHREVSRSDSFELVLISLWQKILRTEHLKPTSNFFHHGGDSLSAMELALEIGHLINCPVSVIWIHQSPTPRTMTEQCARFSLQSPASPARPLRKTLFQMPGLGGRDEVQSRIAFVLPSDWESCDTIDFPARKIAQPRSLKFEELATAMITQIRQIQPDGPYHLSGFSFGALIAYEVARQLVASGQQVAKLILWDPGFFAELNHESTTEVWGKAWSKIMRKIRANLHPRNWDRLFTLSSVTKSQLKHPFRWIIPSQRATEILRIRCNWHENFHTVALRAFKNYLPQNYPGDTVLLQCQRKHEKTASLERWRSLIDGRLTVHEVNCDHSEMVHEPFVSKLVEITCRELQQHSPTS